jgi:hypothetical protein
MNKILQKFARQNLIQGLLKCTKKERWRFNKMYSPDDIGRSIDDVVCDMPEDRLDWAMQQVQRTLAKKGKL